jgi:hypothetical protein
MDTFNNSGLWAYFGIEALDLSLKAQILSLAFSLKSVPSVKKLLN